MTRPRPIREAERTLRELLGARGVDPDVRPTLGAFWAVFSEFVRIPFVTASDGVLYEIGTYGEPGEEEFHLDLVRQLEVRYDDGEHDHYEHLRCELRFPATSTTRAFGTFGRWWFAGSAAEPWEAFVALVEGRTEFLALRHTSARAAVIRQEEV